MAYVAKVVFLWYKPEMIISEKEFPENVAAWERLGYIEPVLPKSVVEPSVKASSVPEAAPPEKAPLPVIKKSEPEPVKKGLFKKK
jgi:hypothetical protein